MSPEQRLRELMTLRPVFDRYWGRQTLPDRINVIRSLIREFDSCDMLEIGCWIGYGTLCWRSAISELPGKGSVTCVDPLKPYHSQEDIDGHLVANIMHKALVSGEAYHAFLYVTGHGDQDVPVTHHRMTLEEALPSLGKYDLILVDGSHYYQDVMSDIGLAKKLVKPGGIICGDDLEKQMVYDVDESTVRDLLHKEWNGDPKLPFHPGVTAAVWDSFGKVNMKNAVWWVK